MPPLQKIRDFVRRHGFRRNGIFLRFFLAYCLVLTVPYAISISLYVGLVRRAERYVTESTISGLRQSQYVVDRYLTQMRWNALSMANNAKLRAIMTAARAGRRIGNYAIREAMDDLFDNILYTGDFTTTCYIFLEYADMILTPDTMYRPDFFYEHVLVGAEPDQMPDWHAAISSTYLGGRFFPARTIQMDEGTALRRVIPFVQSLPMGYDRDPEGFVAYLINEETVCALLSRVGVPEDGWLCVVDADGVVLSSVQEELDLISTHLPPLEEGHSFSSARVGGGEMLVMSVTSSASGWRYVAAFPSSFVRDMVHDIRVVTWASYAALLFFGLICAGLLAYRLARPIEAANRMMRDFSEMEPESPAYDRLDVRVGKLISSSRNLQQSLVRKTEFVRALLSERLLKGRIQSRRQLNLMLSQADVRVDSGTYLIVLLRMVVDHGLNGEMLLHQIEGFRNLLREKISRAFRCTCLVHDVDGETQALILGFDGVEPRECIEQTEAFIRECLASLPPKRPARLAFAGGEPCEELVEVHRSYEQAMEALNFMPDGDRDRTIWYDRAGGRGRDYYYPLEMESRLLDALRAGESRKVADILRDVRRDNYESILLPYEAQKTLLYELCGTLRKLRDGDERRNLTELVERIDSPRSVRSAFDRLQSEYLQVCASIAERRKDRAQQLTEALVRHLETNYRDPQLSLSSVSREFALAETYLSVFFKKHTGTNFSRFIEKLRIDSASRELSDTDLPIKLIARSVGYNSDKAFRRAFKRARSVSPNTYRALSRLESMERRDPRKA